jgi:hypothetical protein
MFTLCYATFCRIITIWVADPCNLTAEPDLDQDFHSNAYPDPAFLFNADPDPDHAPH